jgi:hypothetical protein
VGSVASTPNDIAMSVMPAPTAANPNPAFGPPVRIPIEADNTINNTGYGIAVDVARPVFIQHNILSNGALDGVALFVTSAAMPTTLNQNAIFGNRLGIDLQIGGVGVTPNDGTKNGSQPNAGMDYPFSHGRRGHDADVTRASSGRARRAHVANATIDVYKAGACPQQNGSEVIAGTG